MKPIIIDMNQMSESREVYDSKPSKVIPVFIFTCLALILAAIIWMYLGKVDVVVKSEGMIRPNDSVSTIVNTISGKINELYIEDGDLVESDKLLYVIEHDELLLKQSYYEELIEQNEKELNQLKKYLKSVQDNTNYLSTSGEDLKYYTRFESYQMQLDSAQHENDFNKKDLRKQAEYINQQIEFYKGKKQCVHQLIQCVRRGENLFDKSNGYYYNKYEMYQIDYRILEQQYEDKRKAIETSIDEVSLENTLSYYTTMKEGLETFRLSVKNEKNEFDSESIYSNQYEAYEEKRIALKRTYEEALNEYEVNQALQGLSKSEWEVSESKTIAENAKTEFENYKENTLLDINTQLTDIDQKISEANIKKDALIDKDTLLKENNTAKKEALKQYKTKYLLELQTEEKTLCETIEPLYEKLDTIKRSQDNILMYQTSDSEDEQYAQVHELKNQEVLSVLDAIKQDEDKSKEYQAGLDQLKENIESCYVKAPCDGIVNENIDLVKSDVLAAQTEVLTILPNNETEYKCIIYVRNSDIGKIETGMEVKFNIYAYPNSEYGYIYGRVDKISNDIKVDSTTGQAYYQVEASIDTTGFYDKDGAKLSVKAGMGCQAKIITENKSILQYALEKLKLWINK